MDKGTCEKVRREREKNVHPYYAENRDKLKKDMNKLLFLIRPELEEASRRKYGDVFAEIWTYYETKLLERFPYIGGEHVSGTRNLTGAYCFVAMGEVLQKYGVDPEETGHLMVMSYERMTMKMPWIVRKSIGKLCGNTRLLNKIFRKKDAKNAANAAKNPGSFETKTQISPEEGSDFSYHNLVCPLADFAKQYGYEVYMPYLCNLDYVMFGVLGVPLFREHTCFEDGDFCDFRIKLGEKPMEYWPPVFTQGRGYK